MQTCPRGVARCQIGSGSRTCKAVVQTAHKFTRFAGKLPALRSAILSDICRCVHRASPRGGGGGGGSVVKSCNRCHKCNDGLLVLAAPVLMLMSCAIAASRGPSYDHGGKK